MKKFKKLFLVVSIVAVLMVMMVVSVSASTVSTKENSFDDISIKKVSDLEEIYDSIEKMGRVYIIEPQDLNTSIRECYIVFFDSYDYNFEGGYVTEHCDDMVNYLIENWSVIGSGDLTIENLYDRLSYYTSDFNFEMINDEDYTRYIGYKSISKEFGYIVDIDLSSLDFDKTFLEVVSSVKGISDYQYCTCGVSSVDSIESYFSSSIDFEQMFEKVYTPKIIDLNNQKVLDEKDTSISILEGQVTELNTTITEKDSTITSLEGENEELANEILSLEDNIEGLETQASSLSTEVIKLNATVKSLENQMQLKINKAYAEGLVDSEGDLTTSGIISVFIVILTIGEVVALVMFFVSKAKKRKQIR